MLTEVTNKSEQYQTLNDVHQYQLILDASTVFIKALPSHFTKNCTTSIY
jgi:hypothetical protein